MLFRKKRKTQAAKSSSDQLRRRGHLGRKSPSPEKKKAVSEDQKGLRADKPADLSILV